jgi:hypothetical protein
VSVPAGGSVLTQHKPRDLETHGQHKTRDGLSGLPGTLLQISYFTDEFAVRNILQYYFGTVKVEKFSFLGIVSWDFVWFETVYGTDPQGMHGTWMRLVAAMETCSMGTTSLDVMETYKVVLPSNLRCGNLDKVVTFCSHNSRPMTCSGLSKDSCSELLSSMLNEIHENFRACSSPELYLVRADAKVSQSETKTEHRILLVGASNLKHSVPHFVDTLMSFANLTTASWIATTKTVKKLETIIKSRAPEIDAFVFDLLGNSSVRFEQADGTTALPFKSNGRFHLGGNVAVTPPDIFKDVIKKVIPVFRAKGEKPCVVIPPLPRYLFARCCNDPDHCINADETDFCKTLLSGFTEMRNNLIRQLVSAGLTNFRVMDTCCTTTCSVTACSEERIKGLRSVTAKDGVHYVDIGYKNLAGRCVECLLKMLKTSEEEVGTEPEKKGIPTCFFWRGFRSTRGSTRPKRFHEWIPGPQRSRGSALGIARGRAAAARGRVRSAHGQLHYGGNSGFHPYKRW